MKKLLTLTGIALFVASAALAGDGAALYKSNCADCHGEKGDKSIGGSVPLKDLDSAEILKRLQGYAEGTYGGERKAVMHSIAKLHSANLKPLADYAGTL